MSAAGKASAAYFRRQYVARASQQAARAAGARCPGFDRKAAK